MAIDPDPQLEREAEDAAQQALADGPVTINRMGSEMQIQRLPSKQTTLDGFDDDGFDGEFAEEEKETDNRRFNLWQVIKAAGAAGSLTAVSQVLVQAGLLKAGMQEPQTAGVTVGLSAAAYGLMQGYKNLYKEVDPMLLRRVFAAADKEALLDNVLERLGADVNTESGESQGDELGK